MGVYQGFWLWVVGVEKVGSIEWMLVIEVLEIGILVQVFSGLVMIDFKIYYIMMDVYIVCVENGGLVLVQIFI